MPKAPVTEIGVQYHQPFVVFVAPALKVDEGIATVKE